MRETTVLLRTIPAFVTTVAFAGMLPAAPPGDLVVPNTTRLFISTGDLEGVFTKLEKTQLGRLWNDEQMKPFADHLRRHPSTPWGRWEALAGATIGELRHVVSGGASMAVVELSPNQFTTVFLFDVQGRVEAARALMAKGGRPVQTVYFLVDDTLGIATSAELAKSIVSRWPGRLQGSLANHPPYRRVMEQCRRDASGRKPLLRWFFHPASLNKIFGRSDAATETDQPTDSAAARHGFDAITGVGGHASLLDDGADLRLRVCIFSPLPRRRSMRALAFVPSERLLPQAWVPAEVSSYATASLDLARAYQHCAAIFDDVFADGMEGTFAGLVDDLRAEDGPGVDLGKDLVAYLGTRVTAIDERAAKGAETREGRIIAIETKDDRKVAAAIDRLFRDDPGAVAVSLANIEYPLWKIGGSEGESEDVDERDTQTLRSSGVIVHRGQLLIATEFESLRNLLTRKKNAPRLADASDWKRIAVELDKLGTDGASLMAFSRLASDLRRGYEQLRLGKAEDTDSLYPRLIVALLSAGGGSGAKNTPIDYSKLPAFERIRRHLGTVGTVGRTHPDGWTVEGLLLSPAE